MDTTWDCIVVGAGAAGLSAALVLGRARRRTLVIDAGGQSNRPSGGIGGLLGHDGRAPADFYALGRDELAGYPSVQLRDGRVTAATREPEAFAVELEDGTREEARRLLLATGMDYRLPDLPGVAERWGRSVFHCPFCHGWEHRDEPLAVLGGHPMAAHGALLLSAWSDDVTLLARETPLEPDDTARLDAAGVVVDDREVAGLAGPDGTLTGVVFADGQERACTGLLVRAPLHQRSPLAEQLGAELAEPGRVAADAVAVDARFATSVPGLFAAGDVCTPMPSVAGAIAAGHTAAAMVVGDLVAEGLVRAPA